MTTKTTKKSARRKPTEAQIEARKATAKALHETLATQVANLATADEWKRYLDTMKSFRKYSFNNTMLIMIQRPDATLVRGFQQWLKLGRQVRKGETAIKIFGYSYRYATKEDENGEDKRVKVPFFPVLSVFDIAQTEGEPLPSIDLKISALNGEDSLGLYAKAAAWLTDQGWTVSRGNTAPADGYTRMDTHEIVISDSLASEADAAAVLLHEAAHAVLHDELQPGEYQGHRGVWEVEAESVAYVAAGMLGLDTGSLSVGYVGSWAHGDAKVLQQTAERVHRAVHLITDALDPVETETTTTEESVS